MAFDTSNALASMFLWLIFGYLAVMVNCDVQRAMRQHPLVVHLCGLTAFVFLFTLLLDTGDKGAGSVGMLLLQSLVVYVLFVLMTKSKWYVVSLVLTLLLLDQLLKKHVEFKRADAALPTASKSDAEQVEELAAFQKRVSKVVLWAIVSIVLIGTAQYAYLQRVEYGANFSWYKLLIQVNRKCADKAPDYDHQGRSRRRAR